jgi:hypothetical protein
MVAKPGGWKTKPFLCTLVAVARPRSPPEPSCITSKLPLTTWFWAAYLVATLYNNGISALQLQRQLALGSYKRVRDPVGRQLRTVKTSTVSSGRVTDQATPITVCL